MNILVIGCGMVGSELAAELDRDGHDVSVIDRDGGSFDLLPADFSGFTTTGISIDLDVLRRAGIASCDALCAVTGSDNVNIMVAELATKVFGVKKVFARIREISKGEIFEALGINTVCPTKLVVNAAREALEEEVSNTSAMSFDEHLVSFSTHDLPEHLVDGVAEDIIYERGETLFAVIRDRELMFYEKQPNLRFKEGDRLIFAKKQ